MATTDDDPFPRPELGATRALAVMMGRPTQHWSVTVSRNGEEVVTIESVPPLEKAA